MSQGLLGSADLSTPATDTLIFTAAALQTLNVIVCNRNAGTARVRIAIGSGSVPANTDYLWYDLALPGNTPGEQTGVVVSSGEKVWVRSDLANVSVRIHGV